MLASTRRDRGSFQAVEEVHVSYHRRSIKNFFNWDTVVFSI